MTTLQLAKPFRDELEDRIEAVRALRLAGAKCSTRTMRAMPHQFRRCSAPRREAQSLVSDGVTQRTESIFPSAIFRRTRLSADQAFALYDAPLWNLAI